MEIKSVLTQNAPAPGGHYSQAVVHNGVVYVAGQLAIDPLVNVDVPALTPQEQTGEQAAHRAANDQRARRLGFTQLSVPFPIQRADGYIPPNSRGGMSWLSR